MQVFYDKDTFSKYIDLQKEQNNSIGFAPTMGALHAGHISLYEEANKDNDVVISSIFVNPTQFNNPDDLEKYPRTVENDIEKLQNSKLVDAVYIPKVEDIYPNGMERKHYNFGGIENEMEGAARPGHFDGVGTVVEELFRQVRPDNAYFGEKDFQQLQIIKKLVEKEQLPITIVGCPIFREANGLAMSSRNERLNSETREKAAFIYQSLLKVKSLFSSKSIAEIKATIETDFKMQSTFELEYLEIADEATLESSEIKSDTKSYRAFIAVFANNVRLIDTISLN